MATFTNQATLTYNNTVTNSNIATGELTEALSVTKTAVVDRYNESDRVTYVVSIVNSGEASLTGLVLTDTLGAYAYGTGTLYPLTYVDGSVLYYVNGVLQAAPTVTGESPLVISGISVPAGGNAAVIYEAVTNEFAPLAAESTIVNTATVTGNGVATPVTDTETIEVAETPRLTIAKSISPTVVTSGQIVTYTFLIQNYGNTPAAAADNAVITDTFDPRLSNITVKYNGADWTVGTNYTYDTATGLFRTVAGQITVPAATYTRDAVTGAVTTTPGTATVTVSGTI